MSNGLDPSFVLLVVRAPGLDRSGERAGRAGGTVESEQKISETRGGFGGVLDPGDSFGSVAALGDLDGDGITDLAVGASNDDDGGAAQGAVWILFLSPDTIPPTLSCPSIVTESDSKSGPPGEIVFFSVTATDDHDPNPSVVCSPPSGSFFPQGTTIVTCTGSDASGNESVCMFPVVVMPSIRRVKDPPVPRSR